jgi:hypothetical protein
LKEKSFGSPTLSLSSFAALSFTQRRFFVKRLMNATAVMLCGAFLFSSAFAQTDSAAAPAPKKAVATAKPASDKTAAAPAKASRDTLVVVARITEIPGKFASNDLYNYVYIMKYRVLSVVKGSCKAQEILVGHYNPLIPRAKIKDAMKKNVSGTVEKFEVGAKHKLWLVTPIEKVWKDAVEDEYSDSDLAKYFAVRADIAQ